jgi:hypothetical protein
MRPSPFTDLLPLAKGLRFLSRHPLRVLGLALLAVLLSFLGPLLQLWASVPDTPPVSMALAVVALLPMELYFMPRFLLGLDAEALDHPQNPKETWKATFEIRWMRAFVAKAVLYATVITVGATCLVFPGLLLLAIFGWMPYRVLLRGESIKEGAKASALLMSRLWPHVLLPVSVVLAGYSLAVYGAMSFETHFIPDPATPWIRLTHPAVWAIDFGGGLLNVWLSATFLALYHRLELYGPVPEPPAAE